MACDGNVLLPNDFQPVMSLRGIINMASTSRVFCAGFYLLVLSARMTSQLYTLCCPDVKATSVYYSIIDRRF